jgi:large subunit ribosomal protein L18
MSAVSVKLVNRERRVKRVRTLVSGTPDRPRLTVHISNANISAQIIDDSKGKTLSSVSTVGQKLDGSLTTKAEWVGQQIAKKAKTARIKKVVFDRRGRKYHGRLKALADSARAQGLEF